MYIYFYFDIDKEVKYYRSQKVVTDLVWSRCKDLTPLNF